MGVRPPNEPHRPLRRLIVNLVWFRLTPRLFSHHFYLHFPVCPSVRIVSVRFLRETGQDGHVRETPDTSGGHRTFFYKSLLSLTSHTLFLSAVTKPASIRVCLASPALRRSKSGHFCLCSSCQSDAETTLFPVSITTFLSASSASCWLTVSPLDQQFLLSVWLS